MTRSKQIIVTAIVIGACTGVLLHLTKLHGQPPAVSPHQPASSTASTAFPGNATPENALQSLGWAAGKGDLELLRDGVTPEIQQMLHGGGPDMASHAISMATELGGAKILKKEVLSDEQVLLCVQPEGKDNSWKVRMQKVGSSWKLSGLAP